MLWIAHQCIHYWYQLVFLFCHIPCIWGRGKELVNLWYSTISISITFLWLNIGCCILQNNLKLLIHFAILLWLVLLKWCVFITQCQVSCRELISSISCTFPVFITFLFPSFSLVRVFQLPLVPFCFHIKITYDFMYLIQILGEINERKLAPFVFCLTSFSNCFFHPFWNHSSEISLALICQKIKISVHIWKGVVVKAYNLSHYLKDLVLRIATSSRPTWAT